MFSFIKDQVSKRLRNRKSKFRSRVGREVVIKTIAQAVPIVCTSVFQTLLSLYDEIQKMMNSFWWGSSSNNGKSFH